jgi:hypothetical protein
MEVPTNPGSVMVFYWRNPGGEKREFLLFALFPSPYFSKAALFA